MIEIGDKIFKTKNEATNFIRTILYKYPLNSPLIDDDLIFVCDLLSCHPEKDKKIGIGVKSIIVEKEKTYNKTIHFSIIRTDNSKVDFSFGKCLTPSLNTPIKLFHSSARRAVASQIISFRNNFFHENQDCNGSVTCELTNILVDRKSSHVDHVPPDTFYKIVSDFITRNNIDVSKTEFIGTADGIGREFGDSNLRRKFFDYHSKMAKLRIVSPFANLSQTKK